MMMSYGFTKLCRISHAAHLVFEEAWYVQSRVSESAHNRFLVTSRQMWQLSSEDYIKKFDVSCLVTNITLPMGDEGRKCFYLTTHSTHLVTVIWCRDIWTMVKDHSHRERKPAPATWATLFDYQQEFFYMHHPTDRLTHTIAFVTPVVEHWLE